MSITTITAQLTDMAVGGTRWFGDLRCERETEDTYYIYRFSFSPGPRTLEEAAEELQHAQVNESEPSDHFYDLDEFGGVGWPE